MTAGFFRHALIAAAALLFSIAVSYAQAAPDCPQDTSKALVHAREALAEKDAENDRAVLTCLIEAVEALDAKLADLIAGKVEFSGPVTARGFFHAKEESVE